MRQENYRLLAALLICAVLAVLSDSFLSLGNILNVLRQASLTFFIASGLTLVVLTALAAALVGDATTHALGIIHTPYPALTPPMLTLPLIGRWLVVAAATLRLFRFT